MSNEFPTFDTTPEEIISSTAAAIAQADTMLSAIASVVPDALRFQNVFVAMDDIENLIALVRNRCDFMKAAHPDQSMRSAADKASGKLRDWKLAAYGREDVFSAINGYLASTDGVIQAEREGLSQTDRRLMRHLTLAFKRNGLGLQSDIKEEIIRLKKELGTLEDKHRNNYDATEQIAFTREELIGVPADLKSRLRFADGMYHVNTEFTDTSVIYKNSPCESARKKAFTARYSRSVSKNVEITPQIVRARSRIATLLEYKTWADYQTELTMMKTPVKATQFLGDLDRGLDPLFCDDIAELTRRKVAEAYDPRVSVCSWDVDYFAAKTLKERFDVNLSDVTVHRLSTKLAQLKVSSAASL